MRVPVHPGQIRQMVDARVRQLSARGPVLSASLVQIARRCGREGCRCNTGEKHLGYYLTRQVEGKTRTVYVPTELVEEVRKWIEEHKRLKQLVQEITELSIALVKGHVREKKRKGTRS